MNKITFKSLRITSVLFFMVSCSVKKPDNSNKIKVLSTYFPQYDWTRSITGGLENETLQTLLIKNGLDLHCYNPSDTDLKEIPNCDLLIYTGGESDKWIENILDQSETKPTEILNLYKIITEKTGSTPNDEHIWLSFEYAEICCDAIFESLCRLIPQNIEKYKENYSDYIEQIQNLDLTYKTITKNLPEKPLLIADRFPFYYITKNYNIDYYSALSNCKDYYDVSEENLNLLAEKLKEYKLNSLLVLDDSDKKIARAVILKAKQPSCDIFTLDSMQCISLQESMGTATYLGKMRSNLETIQKVIKN